MEIKNIELRLIEPNKGQIEGLPKNPRFIKDTKFEALVKSIEENPEMLAMRELLVYPHEGKYVIIGGNMRYRAMKEIGYKVAPCKVIPETATPEQLRAYTIKDNNGYGEWDFDMLGSEWNADELEQWGVDLPDLMPEEEQEPEAQEDFFDENEQTIETRCQTGDKWALGDHVLMCGDSCNEDAVSELMGGVSADCVLTDPPYNVAIKNSKGMTIQNDNMGSTAFGEFLTNAFKALFGVMRAGCPFYVWFASVEHINFEQSLNNAGLRVRQEIIWNKNSFILGRQDYQWKHEPCLYGWKEGAGHYFIDERNHATVLPDFEEINIDKMKKEELQNLLKKIYESKTATSVIDEPKPSRDSEHPTMKPVRLFGRLIQNSTRPGDIVLDTFGGSGTTIVACEQLGRKARVMELDPHYCDVIITRWEKLTGKEAIRL